MTVVRSIRIAMPDRPGALSAVTAARAAHRAAIARLDAVSHEGELVAVDRLLAASSAEDIGLAVGGFWPEVSVRTLNAPVADPAVEMARATAAARGAATRVQAASRAVRGIIRVMRAGRAAMLRCIATGGLAPPAGLPAVAVTGPRQPFAGRVLGQLTAAAFPGGDGWAPAALSAAAARRCTNLPFYRGELERLEALAMAVAPAPGAGPAGRAQMAGIPGSLRPCVVTAARQHALRGVTLSRRRSGRRLRRPGRNRASRG